MNDKGEIEEKTFFHARVNSRGFSPVILRFVRYLAEKDCTLSKHRKGAHL